MKRRTDDLCKSLKYMMQSKDLWMIRALVLHCRLEALGSNANDVLMCEDKQALYQEIEEWESMKKVTVTLNALSEIAADVIEIVLQKNADYGDAWQKQGGAGWAVRLSDKLCRIENLSDGREALVLDESIEQTLIDAIGYSLLGLLYLKDNQ